MSSALPGTTTRAILVSALIAVAAGWGSASASDTPGVAVEPARLDFAVASSGVLATSDVLLTNASEGQVSFGGFSVEGSEAFEVVGHTRGAPASLALGASCTVTIGFAPAFRPPSGGVAQATLWILGLGNPSASCHEPTDCLGALALSSR